MEKPAFYFMVCPDYFLIAEKLQAIKQSIYGEKTTKTDVFWSDEGLGTTFWNLFYTLSFEAQEQILLIRHSENLDAATWKKLSSTLATVRKDLLPVFCIETDTNKNKIPAYITKLKCYDFALKKNWLWQASALDENAVIKRLLDKAKNSKLKLTPNLAEKIAKVSIFEASAIDNSIKVLELACPDGELKEEHIQLVASGVYDFDIFLFIQNMQNSKYLELWQMYLNDLSNDEERVFPFLSLLSREAKILWQILDGDLVRLPTFVLNNKKRTAQLLGKKSLSKIFTAICKTEFAIKSGQKSPEQSFEELIADLTVLFKVK